MADTKRTKSGMVKAILILVAVVAVAIVIMQNTETVDTRLLVVTVSMPRALLLGVTLAVGYVLGIATMTMLSRSEPRAK